MTPAKAAKVAQAQGAVTASRALPFAYEFGGPWGTAVTTVILPVVVLWLAHCSRVGRVVDFTEVAAVWLWVGQPPPEGGLLPRPVVLVWCGLAVVAWFLGQVLLERLLPCEVVLGAPIASPTHSHPDPLRLPYRINGHLAFWVTLLVVSAGWPTWDPISRTIQCGSFPYWSPIYEYFAELACATAALCFVVNTYLYWNSFGKDAAGQPKILAAGGNSGNFCYDFFIGRELNPRIGNSNFDWKEFCELRPGLIGWVLLNAASAHQQFITTGFVSGSMLLVNLFQGIYVWDALYQEKAILTTMDITTDGFGFMLLFGDLCWVPFTYSLQARYLVHHDPALCWWQLLAVVAVHAVGYTIFRGANGQKDVFRRNPHDPSVSHLTFLQTKRGTKLLTGGWWGRARKINYTGDYLMGLSWCLVCGFHSIVPYYYAIYFMILLVHRSIRDDHLCQQKYGDDWNTYKKIVPYRFIPGII